MIRASFHQTHYIGSPAIVDPAEGQLFDFRDHANDFYRDRAITAFEMYEAKGQGLKDIRDVFGEKWDEVLWKVWWWAGSGEKARAQLERWRQ